MPSLIEYFSIELSLKPTGVSLELEYFVVGVVSVGFHVASVINLVIRNLLLG